MDKLNELASNAKNGGQKDEDRFYQYLFVRFTTFAKHSIRIKEDAEDLAEEAWLIIKRKYKNETFKASFKSWAYKILENVIGNYLQKKRREEEMHRDLKSQNTQGSPTPEEEYERKQLRKRVKDCLRQMIKKKLRYFKVLKLVYKEYKTDKICQIMQITPNNLYVILKRGREMLKYCLETGRI